MAKEILKKKLNQMREVMRQLVPLLDYSLEDFKANPIAVSAAERNFQLLVDFACDINSQIVLEYDASPPDTYVQSFLAMAKIGVISHELAKELAEGAKLRNILVHEYDFAESDEQFYHSAKKLLPAYEEYASVIYKTIGS